MSGSDIILLECTIRNFQSYGNNVTTFNLNFDDPTLIVGKNYDSMVDGNVDSNGAGKTTLLNAIVYAVYGKALSNIKVTKLINNINNKDMEVTLTFKKGDTYYKIIRYRKNKVRGGDGVLLLISKDINFTDAKEQAKDSIKHTNEQILEILEMQYEIFCRILVFSATYEPFLSLPMSDASKANQKDIIEELFNLTILSERGDELKGLIKDDVLDLNNMILLDKKAKEEAKRYELQLEKAIDRKSEWDVRTAREIESLLDKKKALAHVDFTKEEELLELKTKLVSKGDSFELKLGGVNREYSILERSIDSANGWDIDRKILIKGIIKNISNIGEHDFDINRELFTLLDNLDSKLKKLSSTEKDMSREIRSTLSKIESMEVEKTHLESSKCPYCKQTFKEAKSKLKKLLKSLNAEEESLDESNSTLSSAKKKGKKLSKKINDVREELEFGSLREMEKIERELVQLNVSLGEKRGEDNPHTQIDTILELENSRDNLHKEILKLTKKINKCQTESDAIDCSYSSTSTLFGDKSKFEQIGGEVDKLKDTVNPYIETVEDIRNIELDDSRVDSINELADTIEHSKFLLKVLTKKDSYLRKGLLKKNLPLLNDQLKYYLEKLGLPHKVEFLEDMSTKISQFGNEIDFANLSSGQKARINLGLSFAFRDVLQDRHFKVNFCILDECLDVGLSNVGVSMAAKMLKSIATEHNLSMYIISHRDEIASMFNNKLEIELRRGFSNIVA